MFFMHDVVHPFLVEVDQIYHLACPASPPHYQYNAIKTIKCSTQGTLNMLGLAKRVKARLLFTSTSEIYGDPEVHPQKEDYFGNVNTMGPRSCYDEGKRVSETMCYCYAQECGVQVRIARIFNTYGPRMDPNDGRVVSNFIIQALKGVPLTVYGDGSQTRSFQFVSDLVAGLIKLMNSDEPGPVNIGNPEEHTILEFAQKIQGRINPDAPIVHKPATQDDPRKRKPDISKAARVLGWSPKTHLDAGLERTIQYFKHETGMAGPADEAVPVVWMPAMP
jgi:UDP-glucuronate decarboxylase